MDRGRIITTREAILQRMVEYFRPKPEVSALFLSGSLASGTADPYSDIDFRVVVQTDAFDRFVRHHRAFAREWGDFLFNNGGARVSVSHFRPFNKVDIYYYKTDEMRPTPWLAKPTRVLHDPEGLIERLIQESQGLTFRVPAAEVDLSISIGLGCTHEVYRRLMRVELMSAQTSLDRLRNAIIDADDYLRAGPALGATGFAHFEERGTPEIVQALSQSYVPLDSEAILRALKDLIRVYRRQVESLRQAFGLKRDPEADRFGLQVIDNELPPEAEAFI